MHQQLPLLLPLITAIVLIEMLAAKLRIAYPVLLVVAGLLVSFIPGLPRIQIDPNMIFFIFLLTLLCQGLTLPYFIKSSRINDYFNGEPDEILKVKIKRLMVEETVRLLKDKQDKGLLTDHKLQRMIEQWEHKIKQPESMGLSETSKHNYLELLEDQRKFLLEINKDPGFPDEIIRWQIFQIDLEEERIKLL